MLTNYDLEDLCRHYKIPLIFCGMKDELAKLKPKSGNYIINLQSSTHGDGTHWTALNIKDDSAVFFDSFGAPPSTEVIRFCSHGKKRHLAFNNWIIQDLKSENCGSFCIAFLKFLNDSTCSCSNFKKMNEFVNGFSNDTKKNDAVLASFFQELHDRNTPKLILRI